MHSSALTDESGAAVPGAAVTVTQVETNQSRNVVTSEAGSYNVPNLASGTYEIVSLQGFQTSRTRDVAVRQGLAAGQTGRSSQPLT